MKNDIQVSGTEITGPADEVISSEDRNGNGKQKRMGSLEWAWKVTGLGSAFGCARGCSPVTDALTRAFPILQPSLRL